ncbi:hypothetical protein MRX96_017222 [Rhipicephalus microplus]
MDRMDEIGSSNYLPILGIAATTKTSSWGYPHAKKNERRSIIAPDSDGFPTERHAHKRLVRENETAVEKTRRTQRVRRI